MDNVLTGASLTSVNDSFFCDSFRGSAAGGISPPGPHRSVRDSLPSYGSYHPAAQITRRRGLTLRLLPLLVGQTVRPDDPTPSLHPHYRDFNATAGRSAPVPRIGTFTLVGSSHLSFSLTIGATGSHVPHKSLVSGSRHLYAGRHPDSKQVSSGLFLGE